MFKGFYFFVYFIEEDWPSPSSHLTNNENAENQSSNNRTTTNMPSKLNLILIDSSYYLFSGFRYWKHETWKFSRRLMLDYQVMIHWTKMKVNRSILLTGKIITVEKWKKLFSVLVFKFVSQSVCFLIYMMIEEIQLFFKLKIKCF